MDTIFQIRNLACAYQSGKTVLRIPSLDIPKGELVFLLGVSGSGKSTLIETLALMNNTLSEGEVHFNSGENNTLKFSELWKNNHSKEVADVRKEHFSFIFQETNLMENFTAYENICLAQMIKQDIRQEAAMTDARQLANQVGLSENELNTATLAVHLSGGQRQRLAFVRAINNDFSVIFGDEPTGNLDEANGNELLKILKQNLGEKATAIVVSHDIDLAIQHADRIIVITKSSEGYGEILPENTYTNQAWLDNSDAFRQQLAKLYNAPSPPSAQAVAPAAAEPNNPSYEALFLKKEGKALAGKHRSNFWILTTILTMTFLAIGFANGSLDYLNKKMNNAFVKWVSIPISWKEKDNARNIPKRLANSELATVFDYENVSAYIEHPFRFGHTNGSSVLLKGRTVEFMGKENPIIKEILQKKNRLYGDPKMLDNKDFSLIVTQRFLKQLGLPPDTDFVNMEFRENDLVPIPVRAVVKEIPGRNIFICTLNFYDNQGISSDNPFDLRQYRGIYLLSRGDSARAATTTVAINQFFEQHPEYKARDPKCRVLREHDISYAEGWDIYIDFAPPLYPADTDKIWSAIQQSSDFENARSHTQRIYHYNPVAVRDEIKYDNISLYFNDLSKIRPFADSLYHNPSHMGASNRIQVDIAHIKEKENFNFLSKITKIIAWLLVGFGAISISLFLFNLLKMHLSKVKMNIGTLKAFGLGNGEAQRIYFRIVLRFLMWSLLLSLLIALLSGYVADLLLANRMVGEAETSYFNLIHPNTLITLIILIAVTIFVSLYTIRTMLSKSPGDLIYNR